MQKINLLTYSDINYSDKQKILAENAIISGSFDFVISRNRTDLEQTDFYKSNKGILDQSRGGGYWLWKPYFILEELNKMNPNDVLMYLDCGDILQNTHGLREFLALKMENLDVLLTNGAFKNSDWTKRDCFLLMGCDSQSHYDKIQMEAGILVFKNTDRAKQIVSKWLKYCTDPRIITDMENTLGYPNIDGFTDHRHDQSILTNISIIDNLYSSWEMREFVTCNA